MSYLSFCSGGIAYPEEYIHDDGGRYRGQWNGLSKHGYGVYMYI